MHSKILSDSLGNISFLLIYLYYNSRYQKEKYALFCYCKIGGNRMNNNECGVSKVMDILGGKWKLKILWVLSQHPSIRFNQLKREVDGITNVMLTRCLETLADVHLVKRTDYHEIPPKVDYALTNKGKELVPSLLFLNDWGKANL